MGPGWCRKQYRSVRRQLRQRQPSRRYKTLLLASKTAADEARVGQKALRVSKPVQRTVYIPQPLHNLPAAPVLLCQVASAVPCSALHAAAGGSLALPNGCAGRGDSSAAAATEGSGRDGVRGNLHSAAGGSQVCPNGYKGREGARVAAAGLKDGVRGTLYSLQFGCCSSQRLLRACL